MCQAGTEGTADGGSIALLEGQLTWLTHIIGAILRGRLNQSALDTQVLHFQNLSQNILACFEHRELIALKSLCKPVSVMNVNGNVFFVQETIDGDLAVRVFGLLQMVDSGFHQTRYGERSRQRLDIAILSFFQSFRKVYVGEQVMHSSKVSCPLASHITSFAVAVAVDSPGRYTIILSKSKSLKLNPKVQLRALIPWRGEFEDRE